MFDIESPTQLVTYVPCFVATVVTASGVYDTDVASSIGAAFGAVIAVGEAWKRERAWLHSASVFVSSMVFGCAGPGFLVYFYLPDYATRFTWHAWAIAGFVSALFGWAITAGMLKLSRSDNFFGTFIRAVGRLFGVRFDNDTKPKP